MIPVAGGEIWAEDTGGDGTPVVLVNPGWSTAGIWTPVMGLLADRFRLIRYDDRGVGRSPAPSVPFTRLADLRTVLDHAGPGRAVIVGHSGGGGTALALALNEPERVCALVLVAPGAPDYPWPQDDPYFREFGRRYMAGDREGLVQLGLATWAAAGDDETAAGEIRAAVSAFFVIGELGQPDPPVFDRLGQVRAPAVVVRGDREYPAVADCADAIASRIPGCGRIIIPGVDHLLPLRAPARLAEIVTEQAGTAALQVFQLVDHAPDLSARGGGQGIHVRRGGAALRRRERPLERGDVIEVDLSDPVVQIAAHGPGVAAERVPPQTGELLHQRDVDLAVVLLEKLRIPRRAPQDQEPGHGRHLPSLLQVADALMTIKAARRGQHRPQVDAAARS
ncbi:MAG TPA: alpha/beta hydrolase [Streptosporangiaceae bacterium]|nr:alpha/beta hydrolase [Streptosporangiaceae bacterium]